MPSRRYRGKADTADYLPGKKKDAYVFLFRYFVGLCLGVLVGYL